ncbi:MAG: RNA polymerase sigma factor [Evtepia gabavorous]
MAKVTRNIALKRLEHNQAQKRGDRFYLLLDELAEVLPGEDSVEDAVAQRELMEAINDFLKTKTDRGERQLFLRRYFWGDSIGELTVLFRHSESKVKSQLFRTRQRLRGYLEERGLLG